MSWIDNHCHLEPDTAAENIAAGTDSGVSHFITVGCDLATSKESIALAEQYSQVWATAGVHPHEAKFGLEGIEPLLSHPRVVAVGEAGFDFHYDRSARPVQRDVFAAQIGLANQYDLPLVIHTREAWEETFDLLDQEGVPSRTVFHCFTGGASEVALCLERGALVSISGIVTFKNADDVRAAVKETPLDRLMVETDSPFLAPMPHRGKTNQPAFVSYVGERVAEIKGVAAVEVANATTANAQSFYQLS
ncbi:MAG: TatD family hydrolase [Acidimicrobiales bacterium]